MRHEAEKDRQKASMSARILGYVEEPQHVQRPDRSVSTTNVESDRVLVVLDNGSPMAILAPFSLHDVCGDS